MMTAMSSSQPCTTRPDLRDAEQRLSSLPPLEDLFQEWHISGRRTETSVSTASSPLVRREQVLGPMTLPAASIRVLYDVATTCLSRLSSPEQENVEASRPLHARIYRHAPSLTALQTQALLPPGVLVQKTVSVTLAGTCLLCTGVGTYRLTRHQLRSIARSLALSRHAANHVAVNAASCSPVERFGMQPGMVSSFLPPSHKTGLAALVLLPPRPVSWESEPGEQEQAREFALSLSLWESMLLPLPCFRPLVEDYCRRACPDLHCITLESEKHLDEPATPLSLHATTAAARCARTTSDLC